MLLVLGEQLLFISLVTLKVYCTSKGLLTEREPATFVLSTLFHCTGIHAVTSEIKKLLITVYN